MFITVPKGGILCFLIKASFDKKSYHLIGLDGLNGFSNVPANMDIEQVEEYLITQKYTFSHNINEGVNKLIQNPKAKVV